MLAYRILIGISKIIYHYTSKSYVYDPNAYDYVFHHACDRDRDHYLHDFLVLSRHLFFHRARLSYLESMFLCNLKK